MSFDNTIEKAEEILTALEAAGFHRGSTLGRVLGYAKALREMCPFRKFDRVALAKTPTIEPGWYPWKHFLVEGRQGIVRKIDYNQFDGHYSIHVEWDDQTWIDADGVERATRPALFAHHPDSLRKLNVA